MQDVTARQLNAAAEAGDLELVMRLLAVGAEPSATALTWAARCGHLPCVQALLEAGHDSCVVALLAAGADPCFADQHGWGSLDYAASNGHLGIVQQLLAALPDEELQFMAAHQPFALAVAVACRHVETAQFLLAEGPLWSPAEVLALLGKVLDRAQPLYPTLAVRQRLTAEEWESVHSPCPSLSAALPAVLQRSAGEAALLVRHLPPADRERLRTAALCLGRALRHLPCQLPTPLVWHVLALAAA